MGRESINDPIVIQSSISLLQERFRELQRMKEMREERELLRKLAVAEPKQCNPTTTTTAATSLLYHDDDDHQLPMPPSGLLFFHFLPPTSSSPSQYLSLSHPTSTTTAATATTFRYMDEPVFASLLPTVKEIAPPSLHVLKKFQGLGSDDIDNVDTSLHL